MRIKPYKNEIMEDKFTKNIDAYEYLSKHINISNYTK